jgi:2Fe-2S ferredoxin
MISVNVTDRDGATRTVEIAPGGTLMETLRDKGFDILALCGGCCSCATCHVFVAAPWGDKLPARGEDEQALVAETSSYDPAASRLSCQIQLTDALDGLSVTLAPED